MAQVVAWFVEQAVAHPPADQRPGHAQEEDVFHVTARPGARASDGGKGLVPQAADAQQHEQAKGHQIG